VSVLQPKLALPGPLPKGETILWRGRPQWRGLALRAFHTREVAAYFSMFAVWQVAAHLIEGDGALATLKSLLWLLVPCGAACGVLILLAWLSARSSQYTITSRRVIMQFGVALPVTLNIPFCTIGSAALKSYANGEGDIPLALTGNDRVAYLLLWPHVRPWRAARAEPTLRAIADVRHVSKILAGAVVAAGNKADGLTTHVADKVIVPAADLSARAAAVAAA
jgi:Bacterial PH domain